MLELVRGVIEDTNERLEGPTIDRFVILFKEFDADDGELTRTGKIRREIVTDRYQELIDGIYDGADTVEMDVTITYQDGRESRERGEMRVIDVDDSGPLIEGSPQ